MNTRLLSEGNKSQDLQFCLSPWKSFNVLPYDLRHSFATYCRDLEIDIVVCMHWMGHSDPKMILDIYDHFSPKREEKEYKKIILAYQHEKRELQTIHNENEESQNEVKHLW